MNKKILSLFLSLIAAGLLASCASSTSPSEAYRDETPQQIFEKGRAALIDKDYSDAIKRFEALDVQYPYGPYTESAQLYLIYAYYMKEEYTLAASAADHFIRLHPTSAHTDYAYYLHGLSDFYQNLGVLERLFTVDLATRDLAQIQKSYADFYELIIRFPASCYAPSAYQYLIYLRNMMADHELQVGEFYYQHRAYVAAAERASVVVKHFQGAPAVTSALVLMAKSYHQLCETKLEQDTLAVLRYNCPNIVVTY